MVDNNQHSLIGRNWEDGNLNGNGLESTKNSIWKGNFLNGKLDGVSTVFFKNSKTEKLYFLKEGQFYSYHDNEMPLSILDHL